MNKDDTGIEAILYRLETLLRTQIEKQEQTIQLLSEIARQSKPKEMLSHKEAAAFLGIHVSTLQVLMTEGKIPVFRVGTKKLYKKSDLEAWLDAQSCKGI